jgi:hypothetical protein
MLVDITNIITTLQMTNLSFLSPSRAKNTGTHYSKFFPEVVSVQHTVKKSKWGS